MHIPYEISIISTIVYLISHMKFYNTENNAFNFVSIKSTIIITVNVLFPQKKHNVNGMGVPLTLILVTIQLMDDR